MATVESVPYGNLKSRRKEANKDKIFDIVIIIILVLFAFLTLYPILHAVACSFSSPFELITQGAHIFPNKFSLENYEMILNRSNIWNAIRATAARTLIGTVLTLASSALLSYILSRKNFIFKTSLTIFWVITMYATAGFVPVFILYRYLHLTQTFWVYIIPSLVCVFNVMVMRTYMQGIPDSLEEAAQMEGAGPLTIFFRIICPLCKPVYAATALFIASYQWNSWFDAMVYNRFCPEYTTLQYELMKYLTAVTTCDNGLVEYKAPIIAIQGLRFAVAVISMLPLLIIYPFLQRYFVSGVTIKRIKE